MAVDDPACPAGRVNLLTMVRVSLRMLISLHVLINYVVSRDRVDIREWEPMD